jgi:hypothetical protein
MIRRTYTVRQNFFKILFCHCYCCLHFYFNCSFACSSAFLIELQALHYSYMVFHSDTNIFSIFRKNLHKTNSQDSLPNDQNHKHFNRRQSNCAIKQSFVEFYLHEYRCEESFYNQKSFISFVHQGFWK